MYLTIDAMNLQEAKLSNVSLILQYNYNFVTMLKTDLF